MKVTSGRAVGSQSKGLGRFGTASGSRVSCRASAPERAPGSAGLMEQFAQGDFVVRP
jgi:hypothetical protein